MSDTGPQQKLGFHDVDEYVDDMKEMMERILPNCEYQGHGADGCVFDIDGRSVIKLLFPVSLVDAAHEVHALHVLNVAGSSVAPKLTAVGRLGGYRAIIKEDLADMSAVDLEFTYNSLQKFLERIPETLIAHLNENPHLDVDSFLEERVTDFLNAHYTGDIEEIQEEAERNGVLQVSFLKGFFEAYKTLYAHNIPLLDISLDNLGEDKRGDVKLRDLSRCVSKTRPDVDFSEDVQWVVEELQELMFKRHNKDKAPAPSF